MWIDAEEIILNKVCQSYCSFCYVNFVHGIVRVQKKKKITVQGIVLKLNVTLAKCDLAYFLL